VDRHKDREAHKTGNITISEQTYLRIIDIYKAIFLACWHRAQHALNAREADVQCNNPMGSERF